MSSQYAIAAGSGSSEISRVPESSYMEALISSNHTINAEQNPLFSNIVLINEEPICYNSMPVGLMGSYPGNGIYYYQWQLSKTSATDGFSDIISATSQQYNSPALTSTTWLRRIVTFEGVPDTSEAVKATVIPETISLVITNPLPVCAPGTVDITAAAIVAGSPSGLTYSYFSNPEATNAVSNPAAISSFNNFNDNYYIKATNKCTSAVAPVRVVINQKPDLSAVGVASPICKGQSVQLYAHSPGNTTEWLGIGAGPTVQVSPAANTTYTAQATSAAGCTRTATTEVTITDFKVSLNATNPQIIAGTPVTLQAASNKSFEVIGWMPARYFAIQTVTDQTITINDSTRSFSVIGISEDGCRDTAYTKITLSPNTSDMYIPNAFSPNQDGKNDLFKVYGSSIKEVEIKIYTQWGKLIYETKDNVTGWDGSHKGAPQPMGIYMYAIKVRLDNEDSFIKKGSINLIR